MGKGCGRDGERDGEISGGEIEGMGFHIRDEGFQWWVALMLHS